MSESRLFSWGANGHGQLGLGHNRENEASVPTLVTTVEKSTSNFAKFRGICGGGAHTIFITENGSLLGCGRNAKGQLALGDMSRDILTVKLLPVVQKIATVACGWEHTMALTENGLLFAWGANNFGQLGVDSQENHIVEPRQVVCDKPEILVSSVAAGLRHSIATTVDGRLFSWGNGKKGQLGLTIVDESGDRPVLQTSVPNLVSKVNEKFVNVVCGAYHSAAVSSENAVYVWGCNNYGQLCEPPQKYPFILEPKKLPIELFNGEVVDTLRSGWTHFIAVTHQGSVYSWGRNDYGQLGRRIETANFDCVPGIIASIQRPLLLVSGSEHNIAVVESNKTNGHVIFSWGWNEHGICGDGTEVNVQVPKKINFSSLADESITASMIGVGTGQNFAVINNLFGSRPLSK